jgi:hypothetical protein
VEGRLTGGAPFPKSIRLVRVPGLAASSAEGKTEFESPVDAQGRFAFREIPQGAYDVQLPLPGLVPTRLPRLSVMTQLPLVDLRNIEIPVPTRTTVNGRVLAGNGVSLQGLKDFRVTVEGASGVPIQNDGAFSLLLPQGEYMLALMNLPERYVVKSITYGPANLVQGPLMVDGPATAEIQITVAPRK